ncbi:MlaD family protein [Novosphingobium sp. TH158]|uniref:MlaD family protein n=1 Tax=Novosphingobium sp. TH158 TaxID=2067455 RepID=UPI000C7BED56|nr:MlaD family protein [Novosphingobium sp. TH158]PLK26492.1 MCE family protein [Novosphingobium sp. TH158]
METRANHVFVGTVTLVLLALVAAFVLWVTQLGKGSRDSYDVFFKQSVSGLSKGTPVNYAGVPAGEITDIELWPKDPSFVRVRIAVDKKIPILQGTTATIQSGFTGVSTIQLIGGVQGADPITEPGPAGKPVIPTKRGGLGELLSNAPLLLDRLATLTERLNELLGDDNQRAVRNILANTDRLTGELANASPEVKRTMAELQVTLKQATATLAGFEQVAGSANNILGSDGQALARQLRETLGSAKRAADELQGALGEAKPGLRQLNDSTLPQAEAAIRDLRATTRALRGVTEKIDEQGAGALLGGPKLPEYKP